MGDPARPPEIVHGPRCPDLLVVSLNPRRDDAGPIIADFEEYLEAHLDQTRIRDVDPYVDGSRDVLPSPFEWGNVGTKAVANTRAFKCPTFSGGPAWVARACASKFLAEEIRILRPRVVLAMSAQAWGIVLPYFGLARPIGPGPHLLVGSFGGRRIPVVACYHLSGQHYLGHTAEYRATVREKLAEAVQLVEQ